MSGLNRVERELDRRPIGDDIDEELWFHIEGRAEELMRERGISRARALQEASRLFGDVHAIGVRCRHERGTPRTIRRNTMEAVVQDLIYAVRGLARRPGFTAVAVLTFALGIGATTAVFSVVNGLLFRPLPYPDAEELVMVWMDNRVQGWSEDVTSFPNHLDYRSRNRTLEYLAAFTEGGMTLTGRGEPERLSAAWVTRDFFPLLQVDPAIGRWFASEEFQPGSDGVVVLSHGLWRRAFGADSQIVGATVTLGGEPLSVVGVMPPSFRMPNVDLWFPYAPVGPRREARRWFHLSQIGRLSDGVSIAEARADLSRVAAEMEAEMPESNAGLGITVNRMLDQIVGDYRAGVWLLFGAVGLVLLIACANVANLLLARASGRRGEMAVRMALGASRGRLIRQMLVETLTLALVALPVAVMVAWLGLEVVLAVAPEGLPRVHGITLSVPVLVFGVSISLIAAVLFGVYPATQAARWELAAEVREGAPHQAHGTGAGMKRYLVVAEVALAFVLLAGSLLLIRDLAGLHSRDLGFEPANLLTVSLTTSGASYAVGEDRVSFYRDLIERARGLPGVEAVAASSHPIVGGFQNSGAIAIEGRAFFPSDDFVEVERIRVTPGFFETMGSAIIEGRDFTEFDHADAEPVVIINRRMADMYWPGESPIGSRVALTREPGSDATWWRIVGVSEDLLESGLERQARPATHIPYAAAPARTEVLVVRGESGVNVTSLVPMIRRIVSELDPALPLSSVATMAERLEDRLGSQRFNATLLTTFAILAVMLALAGVYGVLAYIVSLSRREFGVRLALGATPAAVLRLVLAKGMKLSAAGIALGILGAIALSRVMRNLVHGIAAIDPLALLGAGIALLAVAGVACAVPALRATRVNCTEVIRAE